MTRPPSAAAALFPHLPSSAPAIVERRERNESVASAMYAHLRPPQPKPPNPYLSGMSDAEWSDVRLAMRGLRRMRR
jgi:hypothetical protein